MKTGISLVELAQMVMDTEKTKEDYIVNSRALVMGAGGEIQIQGTGTGVWYSLTGIAHSQLAEKLGIPKAYYDKMLATDPELLAYNVNVWLQRQNDNRLLRTIDGGTIRAYLSDRYFPLDNGHFMEATLPVLKDVGAHIKSADLTERKLYLQVTVPRLRGEVVPRADAKVGDIVEMGAIISNSEVGYGQWSVASFIYRLVCRNGMIRSSEFKRRHLGRRIEANAEGLVDMSVWSKETLAADIRAITLKARDTLRSALSPDGFQLQLEDMRRAAGIEIPAKKVETVVKNVTKRFSLNEEEGKGVLAAMIESGDLSLWGLANAVTVQAHETESFDRNVELQEIGGRVVDLAQSTEWKVLAA